MSARHSRDRRAVPAGTDGERQRSSLSGGAHFPCRCAGLDAALKAKVNANNARFGVHRVTSYANATKTKTYCVYEGPSETAIRKAATANGLPVDSITEVPVTLSPK